MLELIFLKILLQISIFLLQTVPKCYTSIQYTVKNLVIMIFKPPSSKKLLFLIRTNPKKSQICNGNIYEIWLTLLCETMTYFNSHRKKSFDIKSNKICITPPFFKWNCYTWKTKPWLKSYTYQKLKPQLFLTHDFHSHYL